MRSTERPTGSEITGWQRPEPPLPSEIGPPPGETGSAERWTMATAVGTLRQELQTAWLGHILDKHPLIINKMVDQFAKQSLGQELKWKLSSNTSAKDKFQYIGCIIPATGDFDMFVSQIVLICQPMPVKEIARAIARLKMMTAERRRDDIDIQHQTELYIAELQNWPADVVKQATHPRYYKFFPTWKELLENLEFWGDKRQVLIKAIEEKMNA